DWRGGQNIGQCFGHIPQCHSMQSFAIKAVHLPEGGFAQPCRLVENRFEYRCEIAGRAVDDLQYLGGRGLLLQRLARLGQEPRVLHRDDRLRREVLQQRDLFFTEWPYFLAIYSERTKQGLFATERDSKEGTPSGNNCVPRAFVSGTVSFRIQGIGDMNERFAS